MTVAYFFHDEYDGWEYYIDVLTRVDLKTFRILHGRGIYQFSSRSNYQFSSRRIER